MPNGRVKAQGSKNGGIPQRRKKKENNLGQWSKDRVKDQTDMTLPGINTSSFLQRVEREGINRSLAKKKSNERTGRKGRSYL